MWRRGKRYPEHPGITPLKKESMKRKQLSDVSCLMFLIKKKGLVEISSNAQKEVISLDTKLLSIEFTILKGQVFWALLYLSFLYSMTDGMHGILSKCVQSS